jgi:hypothetical protein
MNQAEAKALIIDLEGCLSGRRITVNDTSRELLERIASILGFGRIYGQKINNGINKQPIWQLVIYRQDEVKAILEEIAPYLLKRREDASKILTSLRKQ